MEKLQELIRDNAQAIQVQRAIAEENSGNIQSLQGQMAVLCSQLTELKEMLNNRGMDRDRNGDSRFVRLGRLDFPKFNGEDVEGWIYKCKHFFTIDKTPEAHKVQIAVINLEGAALQWHQLHVNSQNRVVEEMNWADYERSITNRFSTRLSEEPMEDLKNLQQTSTLQEYCEAFDALLYRVVLCEEYAAGLFIAGLKPEIRCLVKIFKPKTVRDAIAMAKQQEVVYSTLFGPKEVKKWSGSTTSTMSSTSTSFKGSNQPLTTSNSSFKATNTNALALLPTPVNKTAKPIRKIPTKEAQEKLAKGECFWCPEKYTSTHNCKFKQLYSLHIEADDEGCEATDMINIQDLSMEPQISLNALMGVPSFNTMKVIGCIGTRQLQILIDSGSTHNFLDSELAAKLRCPMKEVTSMPVIVADGNNLPCTRLCQDFQWVMQGVWYKSDVLLLPLKNYDMVLGIQWLQTLNNIIWNFKTLTMKFKIGSQTFELKGAKQFQSSLSLCSMEMMVKQLKANGSQAQMCSIQLDGAFQHQAKVIEGHESEQMNALLTEFDDVFQEPKSLPPKRSCDHKIQLINESAVINQRAYRYPIGQKDVIEKMVQEMKDLGFIRDSVSSFASPVVLVKKKRWIMEVMR
ncbi:uncharacterized protein LOC110934084 [Helianthus annuus]|uniref:uncharacterized protein LOC110934084 n=1 Tax=Helianthus annuus TaxID=4232 RepID=UPI000B904338|nr:uncharacterized protein LOC110934084 [Helianthus annuus]